MEATPSYSEIIAKRLRVERGFVEPAILLSCGESLKRLVAVNDMSQAAACGESWTVNIEGHEFVPRIVLCHVKGVIRLVYGNAHWTPTRLVLGERLQGLQHYLTKPYRNQDPAEMLRSQYVAEQLRLISNYLPDKGEWCFTGDILHDHPVLGMDLSEELTVRGMANPVRLINCDS